MAKAVRATKVASVRALAAAVGRAHSGVLAWMKRPDWPFARKSPGPWDPAAVKAWADRTLTPEPGSDDEAGGVIDQDVRLKVSLKKMLGQIKKLELGNQVLEEELKKIKGESIDSKDVERERLQRIEAVKSELMTIGTLAVRLPVSRDDVPQVESILIEWARGVCRKFSGT